MLSLGVVTDVHLGPSASFGGKLRKLSHRAEPLLTQFARCMRQDVQPDLVVNLGDLIEDESSEQDDAHYRRGVELLAASGVPVVHVAGNHDRVNLSRERLRSMWGLDAAGPLYRSFDVKGVHVVVLATHETKDVEVAIDDEQLAWLEADLSMGEAPTVVLMHHSAADQDLKGNRWFEKAAHLCLVKQRKRLRRILHDSGQVKLVLNGHLHWNHLDVVDGIPYLTLQSLIENIEEDAPGKPAAAYAVVRVDRARMDVTVGGAQPARYQFSQA